MVKPESAVDPLVSLCIPVFNGARHLDAALQSARRQRFSRLEILVVDDCSTDQSLAIVERHRSEDPRVRVSRNDANLGLVGNWERCVELARGSHVKFLFQDDLLDPACVQRLWDGMQASGASMGFVTRRLLMDELSRSAAKSFAPIEERNVGRMLDRSRYLSADEVARFCLDHWTVNILGEPTSVMLRRDLFERLGGFDDRFKQLCDWEYWIRVGLHDGLWFEVAPLATFRLHPAATSVHNRSDREVWTVYGEAALFSCKALKDASFAPLRASAAAVTPAVDLTRRAARSLLRFRLRAAHARSHPNLVAAQELATQYEVDVDLPRLIVAVEWIWVRVPERLQRLINWARYLGRHRRYWVPAE